MRLVVDACVLRSAGTSEEGCSKSCRHTLQEISRRRHRVHYDSLLHNEWKRHSSKFASKWRVQMQQRGLLTFVDPLVQDAGLTTAVTSQLPKISHQRAALKDIHLVALALQADKAILSRDGTARGLFVRIGEGERRLRKLLWIDPTQHPDETTAWIRNEAEPLGQWRLVNNEAAK